MIERMANKIGARFDPSFSWGSAINFIGILITLAGVVGGYYVLTYRVGQLETIKARTDADHDRLGDVANDVKWIRSIIEKRTQLGLPSPFDPTEFAARYPGAGKVAGTAAVGIRGEVD